MSHPIKASIVLSVSLGLSNLLFAQVGTPHKQEFLEEARASLVDGKTLETQRIEDFTEEKSEISGCKEIAVPLSLSVTKLQHFFEAEFTTVSPSLEKLAVITRLKQEDKELMSTSMTIDPTSGVNTAPLGSLELSDTSKELKFVYCVTTSNQTALELKTLIIHSY